MCGIVGQLTHIYQAQKKPTGILTAMYSSQRLAATLKTRLYSPQENIRLYETLKEAAKQFKNEERYIRYVLARFYTGSNCLEFMDHPSTFTRIAETEVGGKSRFAGFASIHRKSADTLFYVHPECRRQKVAHQLFDALLKDAAELGLPYMRADVLPENWRANQFFNTKLREGIDRHWMTGNPISIFGMDTVMSCHEFKTDRGKVVSISLELQPQ